MCIAAFVTIILPALTAEYVSQNIVQFTVYLFLNYVFYFFIHVYLVILRYSFYI